MRTDSCAKHEMYGKIFNGENWDSGTGIRTSVRERSFTCAPTPYFCPHTPAK